VIGVVVVCPVSFFDHPSRCGLPTVGDIPTLESGTKGSSNFNAKMRKYPHCMDFESHGGLDCKLIVQRQKQDLLFL
jgi:hypothetical protein